MSKRDIYQLQQLKVLLVDNGDVVLPHRSSQHDFGVAMAVDDTHQPLQSLSLNAPATSPRILMRYNILFTLFSTLLIEKRSIFIASYLKATLDLWTLTRRDFGRKLVVFA